MLAITLSEAETKGFMNKLLKEEMFDGFDVRSVVVNSFVRLELDGTPEQPAAEGDTVQKPAYCVWSKVRPYVFQFIRGSERPKSMKFIFALAAADVEAMFPEAAALFLNITFDGQISVTTGASQKKFTLDKTLDHAWGSYVQSYLEENNIKIEMEF